MELRQLEAFIKVAEHKHFGRAAEELMLTQPPLSQRISTLEQELGVKLLERTTRRVELTDAGELLYDHAIEIMQRVEAASLEVSEIAKGMRGVLRLGVVGSAMYRQLPVVVQHLKNALPESDVQVIPEFFTERQMSMLSDKRIDIGLVRNATETDDINVRVLGYESFIVAARHDDPIQHNVTLQDLEGRMILSYPSEQSVIGRQIRGYLEAAGLTSPNIIEVSHTSSMLAMVAAGYGVAILAESAAALQLPGLRYARIGDTPQVGLELVYRKKEPRALVQRAIQVVSSIEPHELRAQIPH